jgi:hypothetical protein
LLGEGFGLHVLMGGVDWGAWVVYFGSRVGYGSGVGRGWSGALLCWAAEGGRPHVGLVGLRFALLRKGTFGVVNTVGQSWEALFLWDNGETDPDS